MPVAAGPAGTAGGGDAGMTVPVPADAALSAESDVVVAIDLGGTGMKCALIDTDGAFVHAERHPTGAERGVDAVVDSLLAVAEGLAGKAVADGRTPRAVGLVVPGVVDEASGVAVWSGNVGFRDTPLRQLITGRTGLPVALGHDVRAGGLAEARLGGGRGRCHVFFIAIGTGIAGAHVVDGRTFAGSRGAAGEIGHVVVRPGGAACTCGGSGHLEAHASARAVGLAYSERSGTPTTAREVFERASAGEALAAQVWAETVDVLADGLVIGVTMHDPEVIVVGGGLAEAGDGLLAPLSARLAGKLTFQVMPEVCAAALGDEAGCLGAGQLALDLIRRPAL
jgi:glucokinase